MSRLLLVSTVLTVICCCASAYSHDHVGMDSLACSPAAGESCYETFLSSHHSPGSPHHDATGTGFFKLNSARTELHYNISIQGLDLETIEANRTAAEDITGIHLHLNIPGTIGPHVLNIFGWPGEEDADAVFDFDNELITGIYDISDVSIDPATGQPHLQNLPLTTKIIDNWLDELDDGELMVAVHTKATGFGVMAIHGIITPIVPEPATSLLLVVGVCGLSLVARQRKLLSVAVLICLAFAAPTSAQPAVEGQWTNVFTWGNGGGYEAIHVHLLPTGKVMFWQTWAESTGLWDPVTDQFSVAAYPSFNIFCSGHTFLPDGRLFVAGGQTSQGAYNGENRADIYNPFTNTWANSDPLTPNVPIMGTTSSNTGTSGKRWYPSATALGNGDVLVMSGDVTIQGQTNRTVQIYQTAANSWRTLTGALRPADDLLPEYPRVFQAPDGRAISLSDNSNDTEFLNMSGNGSWTYLQDTLDSNLHNYGPAVMYDTGKIAYIGGGHVPTRNISMLDLNDENPAWRYGGGGTVPPAEGSPYVMALPRRQNNATLLADGTVLITGGTHVTGWNDPNGLVATAEIWDPVTEVVTPMDTASASIYRGYHSTALLLPDGRVLVTGGDHDTGGFQENKNAEIFSPAYLFNDDGSPALRPTVTAAPSVAELGDTIFVETPDAANITKALWIVPGSVTHAHNWSQRANILDFDTVDGGLNIALPANENEAPIGYYMLFLVNDQGTPSVAKFIRATSNIVLAGDFNLDDVVDAADYTVWRDGLGTTYTPEQYDVWRNNFGATAGSGGASGSVVPEPSTMVALGLAVMAACGLSRCLTAVARST